MGKATRLRDRLDIAMLRVERVEKPARKRWWRRKERDGTLEDIWCRIRRKMPAPAKLAAAVSMGMAPVIVSRHSMLTRRRQRGGRLKD
jgi:hypothetical protein